jgi:hypothetical protein
MSMRTTALVLAAWCLLPALAAAQAAPPAAERTAAANPQMYEDIEILRRLLNSKLENQYAPARQLVRAWTWNDCASCHNTALTGGNLFWSLDANDPNSGKRWVELQNPDIYHFHTATGFKNNQLYLLDNFNLYGKQPWQIIQGQPYHTGHPIAIDLGFPLTHPAGHLDTEGVYLKGQGVVYTLTLPPPQSKAKAEVAPAPANPVSDWDRVRRELHNEKPEPAKKEPPPREPTLTEILLGVLAENGRYFTQLGDNESLTVVVTFRGVDPPPAPAAGATGKEAAAAKSAAGTLSEAIGANLTREAAGQDYELLGDLHQKQGKLAEAAQAFRQALGQHPEPNRVPTLYRKLAQVLLSEGKDDEARQVLEKWLAERKREQPPAARPAAPAAAKRAPLPAKLIVTAPKKLLDAVDAGKISREEFQKAAGVEYVNVAPQQ